MILSIDFNKPRNLVRASSLEHLVLECVQRALYVQWPGTVA
jgi:hypothetical protein